MKFWIFVVTFSNIVLLFTITIILFNAPRPTCYLVCTELRTYMYLLKNLLKDVKSIQQREILIQNPHFLWNFWGDTVLDHVMRGWSREVYSFHFPSANIANVHVHNSECPGWIKDDCLDDIGSWIIFFIHLLLLL